MRKVSLFESELGPFERICSIHQLELAFRVVKRKDGAPGIDGVTMRVLRRISWRK